MKVKDLRELLVHFNDDEEIFSGIFGCSVYPIQIIGNVACVLGNEPAINPYQLRLVLMTNDYDGL